MTASRVTDWEWGRNGRSKGSERKLDLPPAGPSACEAAVFGQAYEGMLFRDALKHGCYELQNARDSYRLAVGSEGMHADLVQRYIEVSSLRLWAFANSR